MRVSKEFMDKRIKKTGGDASIALVTEIIAEEYFRMNIDAHLLDSELDSLNELVKKLTEKSSLVDDVAELICDYLDKDEDIQDKIQEIEDNRLYYPDYYHNKQSKQSKLQGAIV